MKNFSKLGYNRFYMIQINTSRRVEVVDITSEVQKEVEKSGIKDGLAVVYTPHTTTAIVINENEPGLIEDIVFVLDRLIPRGAGYMHDEIDNNADSHLRAMLLGNSVVIPVTNGKLELGTWQRIMFLELDGPRSRRVIVKVIEG